MKALSRIALKHWEPFWDQFLKDVREHVAAYFNKIFRHHFSRYDKSPIFKTTQLIVREFLAVNFRSFRQGLERLYALELSQPTTLNTTDFNREAAKAEETLSERRKRNIEEQRRAKRDAAADADSSPATPTPLPRGRRGHQAPPPSRESRVGFDDDEAATPGQDFFNREIQLMAQTQSYHEIARKRFVDNVYHPLQGELIEGLKTGLLTELRDKLLTAATTQEAEEKCKVLLEEDPVK